MLNFEYLNPTKLYFGKNSHRNIGKLLKNRTKKVLFHYGGGSIKKTGVYDNVVGSLKENNIDFIELGGVQPNPVLSLVNKGIQICKENNIDYILAVGGGSVIDSAKTIAIGVPYSGNVWDFYEKKAQAKKSLSVAALLTIPAAGSETSPSAVITNEETHRKYGYGSELLRPDFSVIDPTLFTTLPPQQLANGVSDMMSHVFERYFTKTKNTDLTDSLCESTLKTIMKNALILVDDIKNVDAWSEIGFAGSFAHNDYLGLGREEDWACHAMEHELSAFFDIAHGAGLAALTPAWMKYVYKEDKDMFYQFSCNIMDVTPNRNKTAVIEEGISRLEDFYKKLNLPLSFSQLGIKNPNTKMMAIKCVEHKNIKDMNIGFFKKLYVEDVENIYESINF